MAQRITNIGEPVPFTIQAIEPSSGQKLEVKAGERYLFTCNEHQTWSDEKKSSPPTGYPNPWANLFGIRVKKELCFCLCGFYNETEGTGFAIGKEREEPVHTSGTISFFANDTKLFNYFFYKNNTGFVVLNITRLE